MVRGRREVGVLTASGLMILISLALFFLPLINGLVGGLVGGYKAGSVPKALIAAILPAAVVGAGLWILLAVLEMPVIGLLTGAAVGTLVLFADLGIFLGALVGGLLGRQPA